MEKEPSWWVIEAETKALSGRTLGFSPCHPSITFHLLPPAFHLRYQPKRRMLNGDFIAKDRVLRNEDLSRGWGFQNTTLIFSLVLPYCVQYACNVTRQLDTDDWTAGMAQTTSFVHCNTVFNSHKMQRKCTYLGIMCELLYEPESEFSGIVKYYSKLAVVKAESCLFLTWLQSQIPKHKEVNEFLEPRHRQAKTVWCMSRNAKWCLLYW